MSALKKKSETCEEQLKRMVKDIAGEITSGKTQEYIGDPEIELTAEKFMDGVYDIEWITHRDHSYRAARLLVAGGGPTVWVNTLHGTVDGYWGTDKVHWHYTDNIGLNDYLLEMHANETAVLTS